jgi:hypothetical protein
MKNEDKKSVPIRLGELEIQVLHALTSGHDADVPYYLRVSACMAVHDHLFPEEQIIPAQMDPEHLRENLYAVVNWAVHMQPTTALETLGRWFRQMEAEAMKRAVDPTRN